MQRERRKKGRRTKKREATTVVCSLVQFCDGGWGPFHPPPTLQKKKPPQKERKRRNFCTKRRRKPAPPPPPPPPFLPFPEKISLPFVSKCRLKTRFSYLLQQQQHASKKWILNWRQCPSDFLFFRQCRRRALAPRRKKGGESGGGFGPAVLISINLLFCVFFSLIPLQADLAGFSPMIIHWLFFLGPLPSPFTCIQFSAPP